MFPIFNKLGGEEAAIAALKPIAPRSKWPSSHTITYWRRHGLPARVKLHLMQVAKERKIRVRQTDFERAG
jgi:hypothetical protein